MIVPAIQSLSALTISGLFFYIIFASSKIRRRPGLRGALFGLTVGVLIIFLGLSSFQIQDLKTPVSAKPGPLLFAGYLGGPLGALVASCLSILYRLSVGGPAPALIIGTLMHVGLILVGLGVRVLLPPREWPHVRGAAIWGMIVAYVAFQTVPIITLGLFTSNGETIETILFNVGFVFGLGILSILVTWQAIALAHRFAMQTNERIRMAARLDLALRTSGIGLTSRLESSEFIDVDDVCLEIFGLDTHTAGPIPVRDMWKAVHPEDIERVRYIVETLFPEKLNHTVLECRVIRPSDGETRHVLVNLGSALDPETGERELITAISDVTELRQMAATQTEALGRVEAVANNMPGVIYQGIWSPKGAVKHLYLSRKSSEYWGIEPQQAYDDPDILNAGKSLTEVKADGQAFYEAARTGAQIYNRTESRGRWIDFHGSATMMAGDRFRVDGVVVDVTKEVLALEDAQHQTELANRAQRLESIGQLTGGVAHDFNNLLAVIMGNLELLAEDLDDPEQQRRVAAGLEATRRGAKLTRSMLAFARRARLDPEPLDLNTVVRHAQTWMHRALPATVDLETSLLAGLWQVRLDAASLESAVLNLLLNARDAMNGHGKLTIETANVRIDEAYVDRRDQELRPGRYVMLAISDTGCGIPPAALHRIFEPFYTTKGPGEGSGIGLSMVEGFVKQSGGTVQVYTEQNQGTTFKLYFPATNAKESHSAEATPGRVSMEANGLRILLAEDETAVREVLVSTLTSAGFDVTAAASGDEALSIYSARPQFDALITDIVMPGTLQGTDLAQALRKLDPDLPMIFMSGYASEATVHGNGLRPEDIRLMKPVPRNELLTALAQALRRAGPLASGPRVIPPKN
ncbi:ATP-binding protein, partial [Phaeobacter sp. B1627]|uniref:ATP-binding protein n=1 Tax=Phaeobacter sp. B1627 TaxID=2583809 RepID=UPI00111ACC31